MFQFRRFPSCTYLIQCRIPFGGFPHSEISGSMLICSSPKLIAAYHVLHRLLMPRHSPCALFSLTFVETMRQIPSSIHSFKLCLLDSLAPSFLLLKFKPACAGLWICKENAWSSVIFCSSLLLPVNHIRKVHILVLYYSWIMQAHYRISVFLAKIVFLPLQMIFKMSICKTFSLLLPSHNCIIIHNVQFSRCIWVLISKRLNETSLLRCFSQSLWSGGPKWTRTIDLTIISRVL